MTGERATLELNIHQNYYKRLQNELQENYRQSS